MNGPIELSAGTGVNAARLLALNNAHHRETSLLDAARLDWMLANAFRAEQVGDADAVLIAFDQDAPYDSPNFLWFRQRLERFVYIDRVITAPACRGRGLATVLYQRLFAQARLAGHDRVTCEVNIRPPNLASDAFHVRLGFTRLGQATYGEDRAVGFLERRLDHQAQVGEVRGTVGGG